MLRSNLIVNHDVVSKTYYDNFIHYFNNQKDLYSAIEGIKYVPETAFANKTITQKNVGPVLSSIKLSIEEKSIVKQQLIELIHMLYKNKIAHRDLHIDNICWCEKQIYVIDWEYICLHNPNSILQHYDITGKGLDSPENSKHMNLLSKKKNSLKNYLKPVTLSMEDFYVDFSIKR